MERFGKNMALMSAGSIKPEAKKENGDTMAGIEESPGQEGTAIKGSSAERWAAIRGSLLRLWNRGRMERLLWEVEERVAE